MARIRTIKPTFFRSRAVRKLSSNDVRILWIGLWPLSDDEGRMLDEPEQLVGDLWALELSAAQIETALTELHEHGRIVRYEVGGERFMQVTNWLDHQRIQKPNVSEIAPPPVPTDSGIATVPITVGREGKGKEREGSATATPFCIRHPEGTDTACRACGDARRQFDALAETARTKPTPTPPRGPADPNTCDHKFVAGWCARCEIAETAVAS